MNADCKQQKTSADCTGKAPSAKIVHPEIHKHWGFLMCAGGLGEDPKNSFKV